MNRRDRKLRGTLVGQEGPNGAKSAVTTSLSAQCGMRFGIRDHLEVLIRRHPEFKERPKID
jgi:hypothetical protein